MSGQSGEIPRTPTGLPDMNGIWQALGNAHWDIEPHTARPALAMQEETDTYDVIAVTGSLPLEDQAEVFKRSLTLGGRLFLVLGEAPAMQAVLVTRVGQDQYTLESLFETELPALRNARQPERFSF